MERFLIMFFAIAMSTLMAFTAFASVSITEKRYDLNFLIAEQQNKVVGERETYEEKAYRRFLIQILGYAYDDKGEFDPVERAQTAVKQDYFLTKRPTGQKARRSSMVYDHGYWNYLAKIHFKLNNEERARFFALRRMAYATRGGYVWWLVGLNTRALTTTIRLKDPGRPLLGSDEKYGSDKDMDNYSASDFQEIVDGQSTIEQAFVRFTEWNMAQHKEHGRMFFHRYMFNFLVPYGITHYKKYFIDVLTADEPQLIAIKENLNIPDFLTLTTSKKIKIPLYEDTNGDGYLDVTNKFKLIDINERSFFDSYIKRGSVQNEINNSHQKEFAGSAFIVDRSNKIKQWVEFMQNPREVWRKYYEYNREMYLGLFFDYLYNVYDPKDWNDDCDPDVEPQNQPYKCKTVVQLFGDANQSSNKRRTCTNNLIAPGDGVNEFYFTDDKLKNIDVLAQCYLMPY